MDDNLNEIISLLYESSLDPTALNRALLLLGETLNGIGASYFVWAASIQSTKFWCAIGHDEAMQKKYLDHYSTLDPTRNAVMGSNVGEMVFTDIMFSKQYIERSEYFQDYLRPAGISSVLGGKVMSENGLAGFFSVQRGKTAKGFSEKEAALLSAVTPHLTRAAKIHWRMHGLLERAAVLEAALQGLGVPVFVVNKNCEIRCSNDAVEKLLAHTSSLKVVGKRLSCNIVDTQSLLKHAVENATCEKNLKSSWIEIGVGDDSAHLIVMPISDERYTDFTFQRHALIVISPKTRPSVSFNDLLSSMFNFTLAERKLSMELASGCTLTEAAERLSLGKETVRTQLRGLFEKSSTHRQSELISLLQKLAFIAPK